MTDAEIEAEVEAFFATIGKYAIFFQEIESKLDQILLLGWGHENLAANRAKLADMTNKRKIDAVEKLVLTPPLYARARERPELLAFFTTVVQRLHDAREVRNSMLHSYYEFKFTEIGSPVLAFDRRNETAQYMSTDVQRNLLDKVARLAFDVGQVHIQLIALTP